MATRARDIRPRGRRAERGMALLLVTISLAILTVVASEFAYTTRVDFQLATNFRDETRAYFLARSSIGMSRLLLRFQKQLDSIQLPNIAGMLQALGGTTTGAAGAGAAAGGSSPSIQLWRMAKIDCQFTQALIGEGGLEGDGREALDPKFSFDDELAVLSAREAESLTASGNLTGCFQAEISDEEEKINLNKLDAPAFTSQVVAAQLLAKLGDKKYEFLFEKEDSNRVRVTPSDLVLAIRDWIDEDEVGSALNLSGQGDPFIRGFSDENHGYSRYDPRYQAKNARFDSLDELYMVHGVNDRIMAAFRDQFTVYPNINRQQNINTDNPYLLQAAILSIADPGRPDPRLSDPVFIDSLIEKIRAARMFSIFGMSVLDFVSIIEAAGIAVNPAIKSNPANQRFISDKSETFAIRAIGEAGDVRKTISVVVRADQGLGKLLYWREE